MIKTFRSVVFIFILIFICLSSAHAFWIWTPGTNKWVNPKYAVKETPGEQLKFASSFFEGEDYKKALKEFRRLIKHYPRSREAAEAQFFIGEIHLNRVQYYKAFKNYQDVIDKYPFSERATAIIQKQYDIGVALLDGKGPLKGRSSEGFTDGEYDVVSVFQSVIKNAPYGELAAPSQYKIGLFLFEKKLYLEARDAFEKVLNDYPDSEWTKAAKYQIALADAKRSSKVQYDQRITKAAVEEFEDLLKEHPDVDLSDTAKIQIQKLRNKEAENNFVIAKFYEKQKNFVAAKIYYKIVVDEYRNSLWAKKALLKIREMSEKK
ncbi:MAG: outer membrane protein assembly factor BamD [Candidatus Omnitrophica bacterium]|nr:outer membrane protein assembly factor BamD [Candidatus Omnitrophota bacterium]